MNISTPYKRLKRSKSTIFSQYADSLLARSGVRKNDFHFFFQFFSRMPEHTRMMTVNDYVSWYFEFDPAHKLIILDCPAYLDLEKVLSTILKEGIERYGDNFRVFYQYEPTLPGYHYMVSRWDE